MRILFYIFFTFLRNKHKSSNCICNWYSKVLNMSIVILSIVLFLSLHSSYCFNTCALRESHFRGLSWSVESLLQGFLWDGRGCIGHWFSFCPNLLNLHVPQISLQKMLPAPWFSSLHFFSSAASGKAIVHRLSGNTGHFIFLCVWVM